MTSNFHYFFEKRVKNPILAHISPRKILGNRKVAVLSNAFQIDADFQRETCEFFNFF